MGRSRSSDVMMWPSLRRTIAASIGLIAGPGEVPASRAAPRRVDSWPEVVTREEHLNRAALGAPQLGGVAVSPRGERLELPKRSRPRLVEEATGPRYRHREEGAGAAQVDQVQVLAAEGRREDTIEGVEIRRAYAAYGDVHVAPGSSSALRRRSEQYDELEVGHGLPHTLKTAGQLLGSRGVHAVTVGRRQDGVNGPR